MSDDDESSLLTAAKLSCNGMSKEGSLPAALLASSPCSWLHAALACLDTLVVLDS